MLLTVNPLCKNAPAMFLPAPRKERGVAGKVGIWRVRIQCSAAAASAMLSARQCFSVLAAPYTAMAPSTPLSNELPTSVVNDCT